MSEIRWALLVSFWGKNAKDVITYYSKNNQIEKIGLVIYENVDCGAASAATKFGIPALLIRRNEFQNAILYQHHILQKLKMYNISHIFLLGYKYLIKEEILNAYPNRIANVHPSLFPSFLGTKSAIQDALQYGVKVTGVTTHLIDKEYDKGTILFQKAISVKDNDTFDSIYPKFSKIGLTLILKTMKKIENELN